MKIQFTILLIELEKTTPRMLNARRLSWRLGFRLYKLVKIRWARCTQCCFWFPRIFLGRLIRTIDNLNMQVCSSRNDCYWNALCTLDGPFFFYSGWRYCIYTNHNMWIVCTSFIEYWSRHEIVFLLDICPATWFYRVLDGGLWLISMQNM